MLIQKIYALCMIMVIISFLGFVVENIWIAGTKGFMDNRGIFLPFLWMHFFSLCNPEMEDRNTEIETGKIGECTLCFAY